MKYVDGCCLFTGVFTGVVVAHLRQCQHDGEQFFPASFLQSNRFQKRFFQLNSFNLPYFPHRSLLEFTTLNTRIVPSYVA